MSQYEEEDIIYSDVAVDGTRHIKAASLSRLVDELTQERVSSSYVKFRDTFLLSFREFATADVVLDMLIARYESPQREAKDTHTLRRLRVIVVMKAWMEQYFNDFKEESIRLKVDAFLVSLELTMASNAKQLRATFEKAQARLEEESLPVYVHAAAPAPMPAGGWTALSERVLAEQMTLLDSKMYLAVQPKECFGLAWTKRDKEINAPNICAIIKRFNTVSGWVTSSIVTRILRSQRVEVLRKFIRLMEHLRDLNNFNGMMAILSGIHSSALHQMKLTFTELCQDTDRLRDIETLLSPSLGYQRYRTHLKSTLPPCVPYLGVYLRDLTFVVDGGPERYGDLIKFSMYCMQADIIFDIKCHQIKYDLEIFPEILDFLTNLTAMSEEDCYVWSLKVEPRPPKGVVVGSEVIL